MRLRPSFPCPACEQDNPSGATHCIACAAALPHGAADPAAPAAATGGEREPTIVGAGRLASELHLTLRPIVVPRAADGPGAWPGAGAEPDAAAPGGWDPGERATPPAAALGARAAALMAAPATAPMRAPMPAPTAAPTAVPSGPALQSLRDAAKAARRAEVRRALRAQGRAALPSIDSPRLLILDESETARSDLALLLESFGFLVDPACGIQQACTLLASRPFAAALLYLAFDHTHHSAEATLCQRVKHAASPAGGRAPALIVVADPARSIDRVRAELAGADAVLCKPLVRGKLVRALEDCGIALPLDPRRA